MKKNGRAYPTVPRGKHVKIRHLEKEGWSMMIGGREIPHVRAVNVRFAVDAVDTVAVEFYPGGVSLDTDVSVVKLRPVFAPPGGWRRFYVGWRAWARWRWLWGW